MNGENIKKVYVINLDNRRVILLTGLFFLLFGISFIAGLKWKVNTVQNINGENESVGSVVDSDENRVLVSTMPGKENNILALPEEDNRIFNQQTRKDNDPFLADPPNHSNVSTVKGYKTHKIAQKNTVEDQDKDSVVPNKIERLYTIQVAAFVHEKDAVSYQGKLKKMDIDSRIDHGKTYYYVRAGKSADKKLLQPLLKKINTSMKIQAILVQRKIP